MSSILLVLFLCESLTNTITLFLNLVPKTFRGSGKCIERNFHPLVLSPPLHRGYKAKL